jgi:hypothetical protein
MTSHWEEMSAVNRKSGKSRSRSLQDDKSLGGDERGEQEKRQVQKQVLTG